MIHFNNKEELQIINVFIDDLITWSKTKLKELLGYDYQIWCAPSISKNYLGFNVDETTMTDNQWDTFSKEFEVPVGHSDINLKILLKKVFGESRHTFMVHELDEFYIIRHVQKSTIKT